MRLAECYELYDIQHDPVKDTWLIYYNGLLTHCNTALMTSVNATCKEEYYKLEMIISKGGTNKDTQRPRYIGLNE
jgi:hypothetical protein